MIINSINLLIFVLIYSTYKITKITIMIGSVLKVTKKVLNGLENVGTLLTSKNMNSKLNLMLVDIVFN